MDQQLEAARRLKEQEVKLRQVLKAILDDAAFQRLSLMRMSNEALYGQIVSYIFSMYQSGKLRGKIDEGQLKRIASLFLSQKREGSITRLSK